MRPNMAASSISFNSLVSKVASICCVVCTRCNVLQLLDLAHASWQDISQKRHAKAWTTRINKRKKSSQSPKYISRWLLVLLHSHHSQSSGGENMGFPTNTLRYPAPLPPFTGPWSLQSSRLQPRTRYTSRQRVQQLPLISVYCTSSKHLFFFPGTIFFNPF